ncbi:MAG: hypothetical protein K2X39_07370 [Silvanigrellaceae bacterium]|nr:hypothetical protein [Silvanigrellaceae bacterium]
MKLNVIFSICICFLTSLQAFAITLINFTGGPVAAYIAPKGKDGCNALVKFPADLFTDSCNSIWGNFSFTWNNGNGGIPSHSAYQWNHAKESITIWVGGKSSYGYGSTGTKCENFNNESIVLIKNGVRDLACSAEEKCKINSIDSCSFDVRNALKNITVFDYDGRTVN